MRYMTKKTTVLTPNPAHVNISAGGVARYATNKTAAIKLLEYLASPSGSEGLAAPTFEHPLKEVNQNPIVKKNDEGRTSQFSFSEKTFDLEGEGRTIYDALLSNNKPLPSWITFLPSQKHFWK